MRMLLACSALLCAALPAQTLLAGVFDQQVVAPGQQVVLNVTATAATTLTTGCGYTRILAGSPSGPVAFTPILCPRILLTAGPGFTVAARFSGSATGGAPLAPGLYFMEVTGRDPSQTLIAGYFPFRVDDPALPTPPVLTASVSTATRPLVTAATGGRFDLVIQAPSEANAVFFLAASSTTNVGQSFPPLFVALDPDFIFSLSFPTALPGIFDNFVSTLDGAGQAAGMGINVPAGALPAGFPLAVQGLILGTSGVVLTNPVSLATL